MDITKFDDSIARKSLNNLLTVIYTLPTHAQISEQVNSFFVENSVPEELVPKIDNVLKSLGIEKINRESLHGYVANTLNENFNFSIEHSERAVNLAHNLIGNYLHREELKKTTRELQFKNQINERELQEEIRILNDEIESRIAKQVKLLDEYSFLLSQKDLTAQQLVRFTQDFLQLDIIETNTEEDVQSFLNGNKNIIFEL